MEHPDHEMISQAPLAPSICLDASESNPQDVSRFAPLFHSAWSRLPEFVTRLISCHWKRRAETFLIRFYSFGKNSAGNTRSGGHDLRFNRDLFAIMPDELAITAIAHELGHVMFLALKEEWHQRAESMPGVFVNVWSAELINLELTRRLGFPQDRFSEWVNCAVSTEGPYLRDTAGEPRVDVSEFREKVARFMTKWGKEQGLFCEDSIEDAYRALIDNKEPYYRMATTGSKRYEKLLATSLEALGRSLTAESND